MSLRSIYFIAFILVTGQRLLAQKTGVAANDRPNVILIFTDDQGYNDVGVFGADDIDTPNLNQMAKDGAMLTHF